MKYAVLLTDAAAHDLEDLYEFIARHDTQRKADAVFNKLVSLLEALADSPERGTWPKELIPLGIREYRQVLFKPYRAIYRVSGSEFRVVLVADGRRDMQALLEQRLLEFD